MVLMLLDHVRMYFHYDAFFFEPNDIEKTTLPIFLTRWVTHFCAPVFVFLAGVSTFISSQKRDKKSLSIWLLKRGLWLIVLELTVVKFAWLFRVDFTNIDLMVIWVLGISMVLLAGIIHLPRKLILLSGLVIVFGHNLLDNLHPQSNNVVASVWQIFHIPGMMQFESMNIYVSYPILPWVGLMALGYWFGMFYLPEYKKDARRRILLLVGILAVLCFLVLRVTNLYGEPNTFSIQETLTNSVISFLNVTKYPASLQYILITMGPALIIMAVTENVKDWLSTKLIVIGKVPLFFYVLHIFIVHIMATLLATVQGFKPTDMIIDFWVTYQPELKGYGISLVMVYLIVLVLILIAYPFCTRFYNYKRTQKHYWWLKYL